ncbi:facilitated trehalose transporter Tret1-like [Lepeophtheirus salmonis]|uniref:facilitated trehalose transporter Tret1-like n=1 Tax=Lepeophtheirus salmonis TaxID=72036 RepID=UPI001AE66CBE|nr:facilitated trehalose transporter Tret1-like [Lepeophtheirus salmonis]
MATFNQNQIFASSILVSISLISGFIKHSSSIICARIVDNVDQDPVLENISTEQVSWIASTLALGEVIGYSTSYYFETFLGPKSTLIGNLTFLLLGSSILATGSRIPILCLGRIILGISLSSSHTASLSLLSEILGLHSYTSVGFLLYVGKILGTLIMASLGSLIASWRTAFAVFSISIGSINLLSLILIMKESPSWLMMKKKNVSLAHDSLMFYTKSNIKEVESILTKLRSFEEWEEENSSFTSFRDWIKSFRYSYLTNNFIYLCLSFILLEWSSFPVFNYYYVSILKLLKPPISPFISSVILQGIYFSISAIICLTMTVKDNSFPKKHLYFSSGIIVLASLTAIATYCSLAEFVPQAALYTSNLNWIPLVMLATIMCSYSIGFCRIPHYFLYTHIEGSISTLRFIFAISSCSSFIAIKTAPAIIEYLHIYGIFWVFALIVLVKLCISFYLMPDERYEIDCNNDVISVKQHTPIPRHLYTSTTRTISSTTSTHPTKNVLSKIKKLPYELTNIEKKDINDLSVKNSVKETVIQLENKNKPMTTI